MASNNSDIERAVSRTLRDSLEKLQHTTDEVSQAVGDLVSACASARPSNALPHLIRAQTTAASLAVSLDVLARFITGALQQAWSMPIAEPEPIRHRNRTAKQIENENRPGIETEDIETEESEAPFVEAIPVERVEVRKAATAERQVARQSELHAEIPQPAARIPEPAAEELAETLRTVASETAASDSSSGVPGIPEAIVEQAFISAVAPADIPAPSIQPVSGLEYPIFDVATLPPDQQELHRRANRVAKVTMQDIKMLRPRDVELGKQNNDLCSRLRDDIERARKEYERRFQAILNHPADYFHAWMVEILGEGDARALGEYPYRSPVSR